MSNNKFSSSRAHDFLGAALGVFAVVMMATASWQVDTSGPDPFYKGPLIFPLFVFSLILAGALPSMWRLLKPEASWYLDGQGKPVKNIIIVGLLVLYLAGLVVFGLEVSTWLFLVITLKLVGQDSILKITFLPILVPLILSLIFKFFLDVWFPEPLILEFFLD